ncbi:MAG: hypothetical protein V1850_07535 [Candidatus Bathyarchaeota archaeon]
MSRNTNTQPHSKGLYAPLGRVLSEAGFFSHRLSSPEIRCPIPGLGPTIINWRTPSSVGFIVVWVSGKQRINGSTSSLPS